MAQPISVIVWGVEGVMVNGIHQILFQTKGWNVEHIQDIHNSSILYDAIKKNPPKAVILNGDNLNYGSDLLSTLLIRFSDLKVIIVSLQNNEIKVLEKQKILIRQAGDLARMIEG
jgi:hypothetical protein